LPVLLARTRDIINYRDLLRNLVVRDLKVRYRGSFVGFLWSLLNPVLMMLVYWFVFTQLLKSGKENFHIFVFVALLPWNWCAAAVMGATTSIVGNAHLIKKVYFPREILPLTIVIANGINFLFALPVLFVLMVLAGFHFTPHILWLPLLFVTEAIFLIGVAFFLSALNVFFRDTQAIMEVAITAWFFLTPVFYSANDVLSDLAYWMYWLNPMASIISNFRIILYDAGMDPLATGPDPAFMFRTLLTSSLIMVLGYLFFRSVSRKFGEEL
jgi:lipopolysaccharide transport system permease protein